MSSFLFFSSYFSHLPTANGICARNLVRELVQQGNRVHVICFKQDQIDRVIQDEGITIHEIDIERKSRRKTRILRKTTALISCFSPLFDKSLVNGYINSAKRIIPNEKIDCVVAMSFPSESIIASQYIKKNDPNIKIVYYELDSVGDGIIGDGFLNKYAIKAYERWNGNSYRSADRIIIMNSHKEYWLKLYGRKFGGKVQFADIPTLVEKSTARLRKDNRIRLLYAGLLDKKYRSPKYFLDCVKVLKDSFALLVEFYSKGNCSEIIENAKADFDGIEQYGYVPQPDLDTAIESVDVLVSIGNQNSNSVPSKIISYMSYCKPIIHFSSSSHDVSSMYLSRYPLALIVNEEEDVKYNIETISSFLRNDLNKEISFEMVCKSFPDNTPEFSVELIKRTMN